MNRSGMFCAISLLMFAAVMLYSAFVRAEDWPMHGRDATRNAVSPEKGSPTDWQVELRDDKGKLTAAARNVKWKAALGSNTFGSPVVSGGLVWVCTNNDGHRDPRVTKDMGCLMCLDERTGKFRWQYLTPRMGIRWRDGDSSCVGSTPLVEGERLWFISNRWEVVCLDIGTLLKGTGEPRELWKLDMPQELRITPFSTVMSPSLRCTIGASYRGMLYVITGNGIDSPNDFAVLSPDAPSLVCLQKDTGKVIWEDHSPGKNILMGQWSSPLIAEIGGRAQVIAPQGDGWIRSFDAMTGKLIWKCDGNPKGSIYPQTRNLLIATPVLYEGHVYIAPGQDRERGEGPGVLWCIDPAKEGDISEELDDGPLPVPAGREIRPLWGPHKGKPNPNSGVVWKFEHVPSVAGRKAVSADRMSRTMTSVVAADGLVIVTDISGIVHCLDAGSGKRYWFRDTESEIDAAPLICDGKIYVTDENGEVFILALSKEMKLLGQRDFEQRIYSDPIFANGVLYVTTRDTLYAIQESTAIGDWAQWRGPARTNIAPDKGLLREWPEKGPPLLWKTAGLGEGVPSVAVAGNCVFTLGYRQQSEFLTAWNSVTGQKLWEARVGPAIAEQTSMRWLSQRTPTVDGDRVYVITASGQLICLATADGTERWRKDYRADFDGRAGAWGYCDYPLVDGERLICTPGGGASPMVALDKRNGDVIWKCAIPACDRTTYSAVIAADILGVHQYIQQFDGGVTSVSNDGKLLWMHKPFRGGMGNVHTAIVVDGEHIFCSCGWGNGDALLKIVADGEKLNVAEVYSDRTNGKAFESWIGNSSLVGKHLYTNNGYCIDVETGKIVWAAKLGNRITAVVADGRIYYRLTDGTLVLGEANPEKYLERGRFLPPRTMTKEPAWSSPVIASGRLYLRDQDELLCYDLRSDRSRPFESPATRPAGTSHPASQPTTADGAGQRIDAIYVPTPQDVVEKMLELAAIKKEDVVYDLGCGDGRIVVTAAQKYGCHAVGYDIDAECIRLSRENVGKHKVESLVNIAQKDVFTLDLSEASVITLYMGREVNRKLIPQLQKLHSGSRIVSHNFEIEGMHPDKVIEFRSAEDDAKHVIYLWTVPFKSIK